MPTNNDYENFIYWLVKTADANQKLMNGTIWPVKYILSINDVVFAVWADDESETGVSHLIVKGKSLLEAVAARNYEALPDGIEASGAGVLLKKTAIFVTCFEMAVAAMQQLGDNYPIDLD